MIRKAARVAQWTLTMLLTFATVAVATVWAITLDQGYRLTQQLGWWPPDGALVLDGDARPGHWIIVPINHDHEPSKPLWFHEWPTFWSGQGTLSATLYRVLPVPEYRRRLDGTVSLDPIRLHSTTRDWRVVSITTGAKPIGFGFRHQRFVRIRLRTWLLVVLLAAYPTVAIVRGPFRRRHRRRRGLCVACGYNLKGLPEPRCPECGQEFER